MATLLQKALLLLVGESNTVKFDFKLPRRRPLKVLTQRELLNLESQIGASLFGPVPQGRRREFFCLDEDTWIWHEEWLDDKHKLQTSTIRYEVQEKGVLKVQEGARYSYLEGSELNNFVLAVNMYYERVAREVYRRDPSTGEKLV